MNGTLVIITLISAAVAAAMTVIVLRMMWNERRRSSARVAMLAAEIHASAPANLHVASAWPDLPMRDEGTPIAMAAMFAPPQAPPHRLMLGPGVIGLAAAVIMFLVTGWSNGRSQSPDSASSPTQSSAATEAVLPHAIELIALDHERQGDRLTVRGVIRNPPNAREVDRLTAVVRLFNRQGGFLTSGRAAIETPALTAGSEAPFVIAFPDAEDVGRYRVSFRADDKVVPHVDRRPIQATPQIEAGS